MWQTVRQLKSPLQEMGPLGVTVWFLEVLIQKYNRCLFYNLELFLFVFCSCNFMNFIISIKLIKSIWFFFIFYFKFKEIYQFYFNFIIANNFQIEDTSKCTYLYGRTKYSSYSCELLSVQIIVLPGLRLFHALICICVCNIYTLLIKYNVCKPNTNRSILSHHAPFI